MKVLDFDSKRNNTLEVKELERNDISEDLNFFFHDILNYITPIMACFEYMDKPHKTDIDELRAKKMLKIGKRSLHELNHYCQMYRLMIIDEYKISNNEHAINTMLEKAMDIVAHSFDRKKIYIENLIPKGLSIETDETLFIQCLVNVLKNAIEHQQNCDKQKVAIQYSKGQLIFTNPLLSNEVDSKRKGLGLKIIQSALRKISFITHYTKSDKEFKMILTHKNFKISDHN